MEKITQDGLQMLVELHQRGDEVRAGLLDKVEHPETLRSLYRPMKFKTLNDGNGKFEILPVKNVSHDVATMRHALMFGVPMMKVNFGEKTQFHKLVRYEGRGAKKGKSVLTSDLPVEIYSQWVAFSGMKGNVLVGGLGLGMAPTMMLKMPQVKSIVVVEKEQKIIDLVGPQLDKRIKIVHADLYKYLKRADVAGKFDSAYHDIWYSTGEAAWAEQVVPLYRLSRKAGIHNLGAWGEHEMRWQLASTLYVRSAMDEEHSQWQPYKVFLDGLKRVLGGKPPYGPEHKEQIAGLIKMYLGQVGAPEWEVTFDWEAGAAKKKAANKIVDKVA